MSGSFENIDVPPTLVSFAVTVEDSKNIVSGEFKAAGDKVVILKPKYTENNLPDPQSLLENCKKRLTFAKSLDILSPQR